jgi:hypothetical protein
VTAWCVAEYLCPRWERAWRGCRCVTALPLQLEPTGSLGPYFVEKSAVVVTGPCEFVIAFQLCCEDDWHLPAMVFVEREQRRVSSTYSSLRLSVLTVEDSPIPPFFFPWMGRVDVFCVTCVATSRGRVLGAQTPYSCSQCTRRTSNYDALCPRCATHHHACQYCAYQPYFIWRCTSLTEGEITNFRCLHHFFNVVSSCLT